MTKFYDTQKRAIILLAVSLVVGGVFSWNQMPKEEDPRFPNRFGGVTVTYPGADAEGVERLIIRPLERELREVVEIDDISATAITDAAILAIGLNETIYDTEPVWSEVERAVDRARDDFPEGVSSVVLDWQTMDIESITYALTGSDSWMDLREGAMTLEDRLLSVDGVKRVIHSPDLDPHVTIELDPETAGALGIAPELLAGLVGVRSRIIPGGAVRLGTREVAVDTATGYEAVELLEQTLVPVGDALLPLGVVADVRIGPEEPVRELVRYDGDTAYVLGIVPEAKIDLITFGERIRAAVAEAQPEIAPLDVREMTFQPDRVSHRLNGLRFALLQGLLIVAGIAIVGMGLRVGGVVALSVPAVAMTAVLIFAVAGGVLHQMTVAALVVSLGLLVDNAIVVSERIQWRLDRGESGRTATVSAVKELAFPLAAATGTTLAAFLPLLLSRGVTGDFTRAIPQMVMLTVGPSFIFALTVVPTLAGVVFTPEASRETPRVSRLSRLAPQVVERPGHILVAATILVLLSLSLLPRVQLQFFPGADRNQLILDVELAAGSHVDATDRAVRVVEDALIGRPDVVHVASFVGRPTPTFFYNLVGTATSANVAQMLVTTVTEDDVPVVAAHAREVAQRELPGITFVARGLEQGPPATAPVAVRLFSEDREALARGVRSLFAELRRIPGTRDVRHDLDPGTVAYAVDPVEASLLSHGSSLSGAAQAVLARTRGIPAGEFRGMAEPVSIVVRSPDGERSPVEDLDKTLLPGADGFVPLAVGGRGEFQMRPATIRRENGRKLATVFTELEPGTGYNTVLGSLIPRMDEIVPPEVEWEIGGAAESSHEANSAIFATAFPGVAILLFILLLQFRSFTRLWLILLTIPLATVGVIPGLVVFGQPFGFMSLLGAFSLIGIVVNNAIILIDTIDTKRAEGESLETAVPSAVVERMRPILLTVLTTVSGLAPLLFSDSSLWPPFASAMISGLLASTVMTLLVVPSAYYLVYRRRGTRKVATVPLQVSVVWVFLGVAGAALAGPAPLVAQTAEPPLSLVEAVDAAASNPAVHAARRRAAAEEWALQAVRRDAWLPALSAEASYLRRSDEMTTSFGPIIGDVPQIPDDERTVAVTIDQPLVSLTAQEGAIAAQRYAARAEAALLQQELAGAQLETVRAYVQVERLEARRDSAKSSRDALSAQLERVRRLVDGGRLLRSDLLRLEMELDTLESRLGALDRGIIVARSDLARLTGREDADATVGVELDPEGMRAWLQTVPDGVLDRPEIAALHWEERAMAARARGVAEGFAPDVRLRVSGVRTFETEIDPEQWIEGELTLRWTPLARGVRLARRRELQEREAELAELRRSAEEGGAIGVRAAKDEVISALEAGSLAARNLQRARQILDEVEELYASGRVALSEYVEAEAAVQTARVDHVVARLSAIEAAAELSYLTGLMVPSQVPFWTSDHGDGYRREMSYHHGNLRAALIEEATNLIGEVGVGGLSVRALAVRVGVSSAAYAYHFPDKAALLLAIATEGFRRMNDAFAPALQVADPYQRYYTLGQCYLDFALANPGHYEVMFAEHAALGQDASCDREFAETAGAAFGALHETVELLIAAGDRPRPAFDVAMMIWSQIHGAVTLWVEGMFGAVGKDVPTVTTDYTEEAGFRRTMTRTAEDIAEMITGRRVPSTLPSLTAHNPHT
jgi:multidrug efflux pump subunit AcrB/outer membrane protein TolC/AcrR family transcriptional regulator